jgi:bleomycin hydrolase
MKRQVFLAFLVILLSSCSRQPQHFTNDVLLGYTPVKNQDTSQVCWAYAMLAAIETEHIMRGDSVNLSVAFMEQMVAQEQEAPATKRGTCLTALRLLQKYGAVPYQTMPTAEYLPPRQVFMLGCEYTFGEFARSVCAPGEYIGLTTTEDVPYGEMAVLDVPDNWDRGECLNMPMDSLLGITERAIRTGHGVAWEGDISELGFDWKKGYAVTSWWNGRTTDDHCMSIVGLAHDEEGERYFIMKNSWGKKNPYGGLIFMSYGYFRQKTVAVFLPRMCVMPTEG